MGEATRSAMAAAAVVAALLCVDMSAGAVYEVGDKAGWTIIGNVNYTGWAASKSFRVGDTIVFTYNKQFHDVLAVSKAAFKACDTTKPTGNWSTGNDSVVLNTTGHHYFICGFPGHCSAGQKVDVHVSGSGPSAAPSESPAAAPAPASGSSPAGGATGAAAPSPHGNAASNLAGSVAMTLAVSVLSVVVAAVKLL